jgi:hypothetical protein
MVQPSANVQGGPHGYEQQVRGIKRSTYQERLAWIHDQEQAGVLKHGWKTKVAAQIPYSYVSLVNVTNGVNFSPPILDAVYEAVLGMTGTVASDDIFSKLDMALDNVENLEEGLAKQEQAEQVARAEYARQHEILLRKLELKLGQINQTKEELTTSLMTARGRLENIQMRVNDEY